MQIQHQPGREMLSIRTSNQGFHVQKIFFISKEIGILQMCDLHVVYMPTQEQWLLRSDLTLVIRAGLFKTVLELSWH
jgi:hypothetical protein